MIRPLNPFASYDYAMEMDNDLRTVTVHRIGGPCRPPRNGFLAKMMRRFRDIKEPPEWVEAPSPEETRAAMDEINADIARTFGGVLPPYKFKVCPCARAVR